MRPKSATLCTLATAQLLIAACSDGRPPTGPLAAARGDKSARDLGPADFTSLLYPGAAGTLALGINEHGDTVGRYSSAGRTHGFLRDEAGTYSSIDYPGSNFSVAGAINDSGAIVGWYTVAAAPAVRHGFLLADGVFSTFDPPGSTFTNSLGINDRGDIVGGHFTAGGQLRGYVLSAHGQAP